MIEQAQDLYDLINKVADADETLRAEQMPNGAIALHYQTKKLVFMLARMDEELRVGHAYFAPFQKNPDWMDDLFADAFNEEYVDTLVEEHLKAESSF